jgi:hypothetical protein
MCIDGSMQYVELFIIEGKLENYITHIIRKIHFILRQVGNNISPPANDFQKQNSKTKNIGLITELAPK